MNRIAWVTIVIVALVTIPLISVASAADSDADVSISLDDLVLWDYTNDVALVPEISVGVGVTLTFDEVYSNNEHYGNGQLGWSKYVTSAPGWLVRSGSSNPYVWSGSTTTPGSYTVVIENHGWCTSTTGITPQSDSRSESSFIVNVGGGDYRITFTDNNGATNMPSTQLGSLSASTETIQLSSTVPLRTGYRFSGWVDTDNNTYAAGSTIELSSEFGSSVLVSLVASWVSTSDISLLSYTLKFETNGGSNVADVVQRSSDASVIISIPTTPPTKSGCEFRGWSTSIGGHVSYETGSTLTITDDGSISPTVTLYAVWTGSSGDNDWMSSIPDWVWWAVAAILILIVLLVRV